MAALSPKKQRILGFIMKGLSDTQIASIIGSTPSYIGQLRKQDTEFMEALEEAQQAADLAAADSTPEQAEEELVTAKYLSLEHAILKQMEQKLEGAELRDVTRALEVVSSRQEKRADRLSREKHPSIGAQTQVAIVMLPSHAMQALNAPAVQFNEQGEIIAVGDKSMAPMAAASVRQMFADMKAPAIVQRVEASTEF